ncbi:energy-coupling factor ABC transporter ATP-binding protein [Parasporobacterium paucivorans]|uniref:Cobalt/nickel transport system ATP-binding protein n=1 Tax=Parasporobacterium paucivorans DSM 15970 TaxID=1122934 RepID=A0A1M6DRQ5_9FIRM|nr:cobalt/nickel transport system ATP-binding protein [Parasporobacterium paucivorans DSM 15970]
MIEPILRIRDMEYSYGNGEMALKQVSLDIYKGEKIAVIGSNGAGKSTFFLTTNGVLSPQRGEIIYNGQEINKKNIKELRKNIGIVFQDADNQIIASTVLAEVGFGPMNLKLHKDEVMDRVDEALSYMNLSSFKARPPHYLSGGEKKRVTIADIIAMKPEIIIFDEPLASLDPYNADMLEEILEKLESEQKTLLISTHDIDFAYRWAERLIVFANGRIIADGAPIEIFQNREILRQANLKQPALLEIYESLVENRILEQDDIYPKNVRDLKKLLSNRGTEEKHEKQTD